MKRLLLTLMLLLTTFVPSFPAKASGSNTVFMPVRVSDYKLKPALSDKYFNTSKLFNYLESSQSSRVLVARVNAYIYRMTYYYTYWGYDMDLAFDGLETINFTLYPRLGAILGVNSDDEIVVLLPEVPSLPTPGTGVLHD